MSLAVSALRGILLALCLIAGSGIRVLGSDAVWQWSVTVDEGRAYLWIPENCARVRAVLLAQHNMIERGILEHATMRRTLAGMGIAEVFIVPSVDPVFRFDQGANARFDAILQALAEKSGHADLATAPVAPMGHSAHASFPWNYAAANPARTLAALSLKGDAPLTGLTGSGRPNPEWGARTLDGIPGLMVMSEQEWWDDRLAPLLRYRAAHPSAPLALLADTGHGHFDATDSLVDFLALFLRKAAAARLPSGGEGPLRKVEPAHGWLIDRWRGDEPPRAPAAPFESYAGDRSDALWCFDEEMAVAIETRYRASRGKQRQQVAFLQNGSLQPIANTHAGVELAFRPEPDGVSFRVAAEFITPIPRPPPLATKDKRPPPTSVVPAPAAPGTHAPGSVDVSVITGPAREVSPGLFRIQPDRLLATGEPRSGDIWLLASHPGDSDYKGAVQQALMKLPRFTEGAEQTLTFPRLEDQPVGTTVVELLATSSANLPVCYYVREGPAFVSDGVLHITPLPPRAKLPVEITVVAWEPGRGKEPKIRAAIPVEQHFLLTSPP